MSSKAEVIALLLGERSSPLRSDAPAVLGAQRLVRNSDGRIVLENVKSREEFDETARTTGCFRRGKPIYDPESREVIGYEMEEVPSMGMAVA